MLIVHLSKFVFAGMVLISGVTDNPQVLFPKSDGFGCLWRHVWVCGKQVYQSLPLGWCETCYLASYSCRCF